MITFRSFSPVRARPRQGVRALLALVVALLLVAALAGQARADGPLTGLTVTESTTQAGAHPDVDVNIPLAEGSYVNDTLTGSPFTIDYPTALAKSITVALPAGLLGNAAALPTCDDATLAQQPSSCPIGSQVGVMTLDGAGPGYDITTGDYLSYAIDQNPIFNMPPNPGEVARLGVSIASGAAVVHIDIAVRDTSDYGLTATVSGISSAQFFFDANVDLWGIPASVANDTQRVACWDSVNDGFIAGCTQGLGGSQAFLVNPTSCTGPLTATASATFYGDPNTYTASDQMPAITGCSSLPFSPSLTFSSATGDVGEPDAFTADLTVPQPAVDDTVATDTTAALDDVSTTLPAGVSLSPGVANGLAACTDAQFAQGSDAAVACPTNSNIGTVTIDTPLLSAPLTGQVFVGQPLSSDPASGQMYRLFVDAVGQGTNVKLIGSVSANPTTGQLTASFAQNPQVPFSSLQLSFSGGANAPLANPPVCGTATSSWSMTSYAQPSLPVTGASSFSVTGDCALAGQFTPTLTAGVQSNRAGGSSPFSFTLTRPDGQQDISTIPQVVLPAGLIAAVKDVPLCETVTACSAASQVGTATVSAGAGSAPFTLSGQPVYLTGPYEGAPYGLAVVVDAVAGPYDLGTVIVRQALRINPTTAQVTITSDPLPTILDGVPLHIRSLSVDIDRPGFMRSPTSCAASSIRATVGSSPLDVPATLAPGTDIGYASQTGQTAQLSVPFRMGSCSALKFSPKLRIELSGEGETQSGDHPRLTATLTQAAGQANLHAVTVALPLSLALDPDNSEHVCSVKDAARIACPSRTIVGDAIADTRILPHSLYGKVYLVQGTRKGPHGTTIKTLPRLLIPLRGQDGVDINLDAQTSVNASEQLVTTFGSIPDAAISRFQLKITGGKKGILVITGGKDICHGAQIATAQETGQNAKTDAAYLHLATTACSRSH